MNNRPGGIALSAGLDWSADPDASASVLAKAPSSFAPFTIHADTFQEQRSDRGRRGRVCTRLSGSISSAEMQRARTGSGARRCLDHVFICDGPGILHAGSQASRVSPGVGPGCGELRHRARTRKSPRSMRAPHGGTAPAPILTPMRCEAQPKRCLPSSGGAESIYVAPFDECCGTPDEASRRLARNTQIILKQEAFLARVADPGGGSYYLEVLTDSIAARAWKMLQEIESDGGWQKAAELVTRRLEQCSAARQTKD